MSAKESKTNANAKHHVGDNTKETIEHIKDDAKNYYKGKKMVSRYIVIGFLLILFILQFLLPNNSKNKDQAEYISGDIDQPILEDNITDKTEYTYNFLDQDIVSEFGDIQKSLDSEIVFIISSIPELSILYKKSLSFLPQLAQNLKEADIPLDFQYLSLTN
jgi:hypothetical protein